MGAGDDLEQPGIDEVADSWSPRSQTRSAPSPRPSPRRRAICRRNYRPRHRASRGSTARATAAGPAPAAAAAADRAAALAPASAPAAAAASRSAKSASSPPTSPNTPSWLDFFKIELGVLGQDNKVYYAYNLSQAKPRSACGDPSQETRLYMNPTESMFAALDRQLATKAGIADKGQIILQFFPPATQAILLRPGTEKSRRRAAGTDSPHRLSSHSQRRRL